MVRSLAVAFLTLFVSVQAFAAAVQGGSVPVPLPLFPANNWWNTDISAAPVDTNSANFIQFIGSVPLHPDFGGDAGGGDVYGFPFIVVDGAQPKKTVTFHYANESDGAGVPFYPIPDQAITLTGWVEGGQPGNIDQRLFADRHVLILDKTNNALYELYNVWFNGTNWQAGSGAFFDLALNHRRMEGWTSADAAGLAIFPGLVRYDEVSGPNEIGHALRMTVGDSNGYVYPASHVAGSAAGALPMGARLRLKALKNISSYPADVQKIFRAFKKYGLIVADNGTDMYVSGTYDTRWDNDVLNPAFASLTAADFDVIQLGWQPTTSFVLTLPAATGAGDATNATLTAYDSSDNVAIGYTGTVHFTSSDGAATLPVNYTFTSGDAGTHTFTGGFTMRTVGGQTVSATDTVSPTITVTRNTFVGPRTPVRLIATATTPTQVGITWTASPGAAQYELVRLSAASPYATVTTTAATSYADNVPFAGATYVYKVRAIDAASRTSPFSSPDAATTLFFTDDPLIAGVTVIQAVHIDEIRQAANAMRAAAALDAASFTDLILSGLAVQATHVAQVRAAITEARTKLGLTPASYTDATLVAGTTVVRAAHVQELRDAVK